MNFKKVGSTYPPSGCSWHKSNPNKKAVVCFDGQILIILPTIKIYDSVYLFSYSVPIHAFQKIILTFVRYKKL